MPLCDTSHLGWCLYVTNHAKITDGVWGNPAVADCDTVGTQVWHMLSSVVLQKQFVTQAGGQRVYTAS